MEELEALLTHAQGEAYSLARRLDRAPGQAEDLQTAAAAVLDRVQRILAGEPDPNPPIPTGFWRLDERMGGGFWRGDLIVVAGDTGLGKSTLAHNIVYNVASAGGAVLVWSTEMGPAEVGKRLLQCGSGVGGDKLRNGQGVTSEDEGALQAQIEAMAGWLVRIVGRPGRVSEVSHEARQSASRWRVPLDLIVVDYLQQMIPTDSSGRTNRAEQLNALSLGLKWMAMDLAVPVVLVSQLSRAAFREKGPPGKHDLLGSGGIEQHSNTILLLHRADKTRLVTSLRIDKQREGCITPWTGPGALALAWNPLLTRFEETDPDIGRPL